MELKYLRRYTTLPFLLDILQNMCITLVNPMTWEDKNDTYFIDKYKKESKNKTVLALCFSEANETYHHWKVYAGTSSGVCIQFHKNSLINCFKRYKGGKHGKVLYKTINRLDKDIIENKIKLEHLPFIKRYAFRDEKEYRFLYASSKEEWQTFDINIDKGSISKIVMNPWMSYNVIRSVEKSIHQIDGCSDIIVAQTSLINNSEWQIVGEGAFLPIKTQRHSHNKSELIVED
jgi:hypothetical protein